MFRFLRFEIEIQRDERPIPMISLAQGFFDDRANAFKKILPHFRLGSGRRGPMTYERSHRARSWIFRPKQILLDGKGSAR